MHFNNLKNCMYEFDVFSYFLLAVTSTTCASQRLQCPSHHLNPCQVLVITMWSIMKAPLNTTCLVLPLSQQPVDGQGEYSERRTHRGQVCYIDNTQTAVIINQRAWDPAWVQIMLYQSFTK